jgi:hypothetical protein
VKVLLDECIDQRARRLITGHDVFTVAYMGWSRVKNGELLRRAAAAGFDVLVTIDGSIQYQQNLATLPLAVVQLNVPTNDLEDLIPALPMLANALQTLPSCTFVSLSTSATK